MRNQELHGFVLHTRPYREKSRLIQFYSRELGRLDGIARMPPTPLYQHAVAVVSGKSNLKTFNSLDVQGVPANLTGQALIAGFYVNELMVKVLPLEDPCASIYNAYCQTLQALSALQTIDASASSMLIIALRQFEHALLQALGYGIRFDIDINGDNIIASNYYTFSVGDGFVPTSQQRGELGEHLLAITQINMQLPVASVAVLSRTFKQAISAVLGHKPLKSRELWLAQHMSNCPKA